MIFSHGTRCAGVLAGKRHGECRNEGGIAYNAQFAGRKIKLKIMYENITYDEITACDWPRSILPVIDRLNHDGKI